MEYTSGPQRIPLPFAENGGKNAIPEGSQIGVTPGAASLNDGFPPLTRQPLDAGGVPPFGLDMNGILWLISQLSRWQSAGGGIMYDSAFASDVNVGGYPKGAVLLRADGAGFWLNTADNNATNPDTGGANWVPAFNYGVKAVTVSNTNVTLSVSDAAKPIIVVSGTLTASVQVIVPAYAQQWIVVNNTTGAYTVTFKPSGGAGVLVGQGLARLVICDGTNCIGVNAQEATPAQVAAKAAHDAYLSPANIDDLAKAVGDRLMPVGTIYGNASNAANPATLLGFGTWVAIAGRFVVGKDGSVEFGTLGGTGGAKTVTMTADNLISHKHIVGVVDGTAGVPEWEDPIIASSVQKSNPAQGESVYNARAKGYSEETGSATPDPMSILNPYFVAALWYRTA